MTLWKGDRVVKLDAEGKPLTTDRELYTEYEVECLTPYYEKGDETYVWAHLKKVK